MWAEEHVNENNSYKNMYTNKQTFKTLRQTFKTLRQKNGGYTLMNNVCVLQFADIFRRKKQTKKSLIITFFLAQKMMCNVV